MKLEFTKELKDKWIKALKSGEYTQGFRRLITTEENNSISGKTEHCCLGVLGDIHPGLENRVCGCKEENISAYKFLDSAVSEHARSRLVNVNDADEHNAIQGRYKQDYSNVLPIIRELKTVD